ncbi:MAG: hypothetical protein COA33_001780 [Fluviicola sp.]|nr:hypothetical protein [Fluviicola sp.]
MKTFFILLFALTATFSFSQEKEKYKIGTGVDFDGRIAGYSYNNLGPSIIPLISFTKKKHQFSFGPQLFMFKNRFEEKIGLMTKFKYYPNGFNNRFNSYFTVRMPLTYGFDKNDNWPPYYFAAPQETRASKYYSVVLTPGYGVNMKIKNGFYINSAFSFGVSYSFVFSEITNIETQAKRDDFYMNLDFVANFSFGVGYRF